MTQEKIKFFEEKRANIKKNLLLIELKKSQYPEKEDIPLKLIQNEEEYKQELKDLNEKMAQIITIAPSSVALPEHLYILPDYLNRNAQESALSSAINDLNNFNKKEQSLPLLCIFHGDEFQCHDTFYKRLKETFIPESLDIKDSENIPIKCYHPSFPINFKNQDNFFHRLQESLAKSMNEVKREASKKEINDCLAQHPGPVILYIHLLASDLPKDSFKSTLNSFIEFWNQWPSLSKKQQLIVLLSIKYYIVKTNPLDFFLDFQSKKNDISMIIEKELSSQLFSCKRLIGTVLPKLEGITRHEVEEWVQEQHRNYFDEKVDFIQYINQKIRDIFEQYKSNDSPKRIPMERLTLQLRSILDEYINKRSEIK